MSLIPNFDHNHVLPPHRGNPINATDLSPYRTTILDVCTRFGYTKRRIDLLKGLLAFRGQLLHYGVVNGWQWIDGSFMENIEVSENRPPNDIDIVTVHSTLTDVIKNDITQHFPAFFSSSISKATYKLDHYPFDCTHSPEFTVEYTRYWMQLFTHNRKGIWKGMVQIPLNTPSEDSDALDYLNNVVI